MSLKMSGKTYRAWQGSVATTNMTKFRKDSRELERYRRRDFGGIRAHLEALIAESATLQTFPLPLVHRVTRDLARHYVRRPTRAWAKGQKEADAWYRTLGIDRIMLDAHQRLLAHQSQVLTVLPGKRGPSVRAWNPYETHVTLASPMDQDLRDAREVRLQVPVAMKDGKAIEGYWVLTATEAYEEWPDGTKVGLWDYRNPSDLSHPLGYVPVVGLRVHEGMDGQWFPSVAEDMLAIQVGLVVALSDVIHTAGVSSVGQPVLTGPGAAAIARDMDWSPTKPWVLDTNRSGGSASEIRLDVVVSDPPLEKYISAIEKTLVLFASMNYLDLSVAGLPSIVTGAAVREIRQGQTDELSRWSSLLEDAEVSLASLIGDVSRADPMRIVGMPQTTLASVGYHLAGGPQTLQDIQAVEAAAKLGLDSAEEAVARMDGVPLADAKTLVTRRLAQWRLRLTETTPSDNWAKP